MTRNAEKIIDEYNRTFEESRQGQFYTGDFNQLRDMSSDTFELIENTLKFAYMLGYRAGKRKTGR